MTLRERRVKFSRLISELVLWVNSQPGWECCYDEGTIHSPRVIWVDGKKIQGADAVHKLNSFHHDGLAFDINFYVDGQYISDGNHPAYRRVGTYWKTLDPQCTWGFDFPNVDTNHFSLGEGQ